MSNTGEDVVGVLYGRKAASPSSRVGDGFLRPTLAGLHQPPGLVAVAEALAYSTVCSPFIAPSAFVPGDVEGDSRRLLLVVEQELALIVFPFILLRSFVLIVRTWL